MDLLYGFRPYAGGSWSTWEASGSWDELLPQQGGPRIARISGFPRQNPFMKNHRKLCGERESVVSEGSNSMND